MRSEPEFWSYSLESLLTLQTNTNSETVKWNLCRKQAQNHIRMIVIDIHLSMYFLKDSQGLGASIKYYEHPNLSLECRQGVNETDLRAQTSWCTWASPAPCFINKTLRLFSNLQHVVNALKTSWRENSRTVHCFSTPVGRRSFLITKDSSCLGQRHKHTT